MMQDVQAAIDMETKHYLRAKSTNMTFFDSYHPWEEVHAYMEDLAKEFPDLATISTIGNTYEGRPMKVITMSTDRRAKKPTLWFDGGMHAREWVSISTVTFLADSILRSVSTDASLLGTYDVIICPIINIDGYAWTWAEEGDRMWRKTRTPNPNQLCVGTDANRRFPLGRSRCQ
jgi:murein tripeptide amidase MpaA